ncbi:hypothetical protein AB6A40_004091 [Gnathostoma spinigerum]|uniref:Exportin-4 n=1 Tax=Gnathostoma spinigerum TaxID=75299 RepID=A0ABD6EDN6_9BILA
MTAFSREDIARLEAAAAVLLASPAHVTAEQRKEAEALFVNLQTNKFTCSECQILMEATNDSFVLFEISKLLGVSILREWKVMNSVSIENILTYILQYITERSELANFVRSELCRCCAKIFKRGILDEHFQSEAVLISKVDKLLSGQDLTMQVLGCDLMEATAAEFSSYWRITDVGITWDFHIRAKREFEKSALRNLFKLSLKTLNDLISHPALSSQHGLTLCGKFLHFAETILSWNFSSQLLPPSLSFHFDVAEATALRPPATYKDIFLHESFLPLFFEIHRKVRFNESLCTISLNCLIMLASLMGEVLTKQETVLGDNPPVKYLSAFMSNTTSLFSGGPLPGETSGLCTIIYKLITFHHISSLFHADRSVLQQFLSFLSHYSQSLTSTGIRLALVEDDYELIHSVSRLFESWLALLRGAARIQLSSDLLEPTFQIYSCFLKAVLSSPFGMREKLCSEDTIKDDINEQDDRVAYSNVLVPLGGFGSFAASQSFSVLFEILATLLTKFFSFLSSGMNEEVVNDWREDMHWILLIIGHTLASEDGDGSCQISPEVFDYCEDMVKNGSTDPSRSDGFLSLCVSGPSSVPGSVGVDPFIRITGLVLLWNVLDHRILGEYGINAVSPELMRSSIWCIRRLVAALSDCEQPEAPNDNNAQYSPMLSKEGEASSKIVKFALHRCFGAIQKFPAERK